MNSKIQHLTHTGDVVDLVDCYPILVLMRMRCIENEALAE